MPGDPRPDPQPDPAPHRPERGAGLADWLEGLGLAEQLAAAGLPTYVREEGGAVVWHDPRTGAVLGADQLAAVDRLLHEQGSEPAHAVPLALVRLRREAAVRRELLAEVHHDYASLARLRGVSVATTRFAVHRAGADHRLLVVPAVRAGEEALVPGFQLDQRGEVRADLAPLLAPLLASGMDPWRVWAWLTRPAGLLGGLVPQRAAAEESTRELARRAALRLAEQVAGPPR